MEFYSADIEMLISGWNTLYFLRFQRMMAGTLRPLRLTSCADEDVMSPPVTTTSRQRIGDAGQMPGPMVTTGCMAR
jgi:hypothetical protein